MSEQSLNSEQLELLSEFRSRRVGIQRGGKVGQYKQGTDKRIRPPVVLGSLSNIAAHEFKHKLVEDISDFSAKNGFVFKGGCPDCGYPCRCFLVGGFDKKYSTETFRSKSPNYPQTLVLS